MSETNEASVQSVVRRWDRITDQYWVYRNELARPVVGLRFETQSVSDGRYPWDKQNYIVGAWNAWIKGENGPEHLFWPEDTPLEEMQRIIEQMDAAFPYDEPQR
jgi:hypothetical protein